MNSKKMLLLPVFCAGALALLSQNRLPIIRAHSDTVDIRIGAEFMEAQWFIAPEYKPDVFSTTKSGRKVTFYTDLDSISFTGNTGDVFDFIIVKNGKDSAYTQLQSVPSYLDILQGAAAYNPNDPTEIPPFQYQSADDPNLIALRKGFNLDSIAGQGNEVSKILNLLHWIHALVPHDGNHENPAAKNAMNMIAVCRKEERGLNCRGLAIVLNECYLALGFKSRFVTCMPKDSVFDDCHVINMVYSQQLGKWVWVDPTHDAYVMDETGTLLSIEEVRERLVQNKPLILNPDANWNKRASTVKEYYLLEYMAKNLYRFSCPLSSEYDYETWKNGENAVYVELLPLDGLDQTPKATTSLNKKLGVTFTTYKTNNPAVFWAKPF